MHRPRGKSALTRRRTAWVLVVHCAAATANAGLFAVPTVRNGESCRACVGKLRGGAETNLNYPQAPTLGDVDEGELHGTRNLSSLRSRHSQPPPPLIPLVRTYFADLYKCSPTLSHITLGTVLLYLLWQFPASSVVAAVLRNHFVTSYHNVVSKRRLHVLLLSVLSHASLRHLALNLYALLVFGRSVRQVMTWQGLDMWPFVYSAAIVSNLVFMLFDGGQGSCIGLSGVTLALLAFDASMHPGKELRLFLYFVPVSLPAYYLLAGLLGFTVLGLLGVAGRRDVAHAAHLGGLLYGAAFHQALRRGWLRRWQHGWGRVAA